MRFERADLGFTTADAETVKLQFDGSDLVIRFVDWEENPVEHTFSEVLAYCWGQSLGTNEVRDDEAYDVVGSPWLVRESRLASVDAAGYAHYKLCFNACGVLDVLALRKSTDSALTEGASTDSSGTNGGDSDDSDADEGDADDDDADDDDADDDDADEGEGDADDDDADDDDADDD